MMTALQNLKKQQLDPISFQGMKAFGATALLGDDLMPL